MAKDNLNDPNVHRVNPLMWGNKGVLRTAGDRVYLVVPISTRRQGAGYRSSGSRSRFDTSVRLGHTDQYVSQ